MTIWYFDEPGKVVSLPETMTSRPSSGLTRMRAKRALPDHRLEHRLVVLQAEIAVAGGEAPLKPEISPRTRTKP